MKEFVKVVDLFRKLLMVSYFHLPEYSILLNILCDFQVFDGDFRSSGFGCSVVMVFGKK